MTINLVAYFKINKQKFFKQVHDERDVKLKPDNKFSIIFVKMKIVKIGASCLT